MIVMIAPTDFMKSLIIKDFGDFHEIHGFPSNLMDRSARSGQSRPSGTSYHLGKLLFRSVSKSLELIFQRYYVFVEGSLPSRSVDVAWIVKILENHENADFYRNLVEELFAQIVSHWLLVVGLNAF